MKNALLVTVIFFILASFAESTKIAPVKNCDDLCFCPCRRPGGGKDDIINPSAECLFIIKCAAVSECSSEVLACHPQNPDLCFCPCRIPFCGPDVLYYPSESCLQKIKCEFGKQECSAKYLNGGK